MQLPPVSSSVPAPCVAYPDARLPESIMPDNAGSKVKPEVGFFLESFAGAGGITAAVLRLGLPATQATDVKGGTQHIGYADLLDQGTFSKLLRLAKSGTVRWLHGGPPCKTFSRVRRSDQHGSARQLRSDRYP